MDGSGIGVNVNRSFESSACMVVTFLDGGLYAPGLGVRDVNYEGSFPNRVQKRVYSASLILMASTLGETMSNCTRSVSEHRIVVDRVEQNDSKQRDSVGQSVTVFDTVISRHA